MSKLYFLQYPSEDPKQSYWHEKDAGLYVDLDDHGFNASGYPYGVKSLIRARAFDLDGAWRLKSSFKFFHIVSIEEEELKKITKLEFV